MLEPFSGIKQLINFFKNPINPDQNQYDQNGNIKPLSPIGKINNLMNYGLIQRGFGGFLDDFKKNLMNGLNIK